MQNHYLLRARPNKLRATIHASLMSPAGAYLECDHGLCVCQLARDGLELVGAQALRGASNGCQCVTPGGLLQAVGALCRQA
jgi:hypothetical protein